VHDLLGVAARRFTMTFALTVLGLVTLCAVVADLVPIPPYATVDLSHALAGPSFAHLMGTDVLGRSILSGVVHGSRLVLVEVFLTVSISSLIGITVGVLAGYLGGVVELVLMRLVDVLLTFPTILLALAIVSVLGLGLQNAIVAMTVALIGPFARVAYSLATGTRQQLFIDNARSVGLTGGRIMLRHLLPNIAGPLIVQMTFATGVALLGVAALGFLGVGASPESPEWGTMLFANRLYLVTAPYTVIFPGLAIFVVVLSFNIVGEGLRDRFDPMRVGAFL
jgi:peptide/nickel transport system permease protein